MPTTTNFGWTTPADTDLVKDGASAIRTLGNGIDTSLLDLKGGTTGQVLSKATNTDLDFSWTTPAGGSSFSLLNAGGTALTGATTITVSGISNMNQIHVIVTGASSANASSEISIRLNTDTGNNYRMAYWESTYSATYGSGILDSGSSDTTRFFLAKMAANASSIVNGGIRLSGCSGTSIKVGTLIGAGNNGGSNTNTATSAAIAYLSTTTVTSVSVVSSTGNFDAGTVYVYGSTN